mgnify:CR=1 FL=1
MSEVKVNKISPRSGTSLTIGDNGDTTNIVGTLQNNGAALVGDISSVVAGTNLSGGGTSGDVTINLADASTSAKGAASFSSDNFAASSGAVTIKDLGIATAELQDDSVTYAKMQDTGTANRVLGAASAGTIGEVQIATDMVADNAITLAKMASGTDGNIISYDASGNPVAVATGSDGQVLTSTGAGSPPAFETLVGGSGRILQYVSNSDITTRSTTSTSFGVNSNTLQIAITPASTSSKILVLVNGIGYNTNGSGSCYYTVYRGSSDLGYSNRGLAQITNPSNSDTIVSGFNIKVIDTPNTTNAVTYGVNFRAGSGTANIGYNQTRSTILLLEIGA